MKYLIICGTILGLAMSTSCTKDVAVEIKEPEVGVCDSIPKSFATDVQPIFTDNCVTCHNVANNSTGTNLNWETHAEISANTQIILTAIKHEGTKNMPYNLPKLSDSLIQVIECWVEDGAKDN